MSKNFKNNKIAISKMIIAAVLVVIIVVAALGAYALSTQTAPPTGSPSPTVSPSSSVSPTQTASASPGSTSTSTPAATASSSVPPNVAGASSLKYSVSVTENGVLEGAYTFWGKNTGTSNFMMRIEFTDIDGNSIYIFNGAQQKAWTFSDGKWTDISDLYSMQYGLWNNLWQGYVTNLSAWAGTGDYSYSAEGTTVRIYDISVNPALDDSLFVHT